MNSSNGKQCFCPTMICLALGRRDPGEAREVGHGTRATGSLTIGVVL